MATRPLRFELHIRPLLRLIDRENMLWAFDLWDYDQVRANADTILRRISSDMPPQSYGGPWPAEWIATFQRWKDEGFLRLDLGTVDSAGYKAIRSDEKITLSGRGTIPSNGYRAWFEGIILEGRPREYVLYWEPPLPATLPSPILYRAKATFEAPTTMTEVTVLDASGRHLVPIVASPAPISLRGEPLRFEHALKRLGAIHLLTVPMAGGSLHHYSIEEARVDVFSDGHTIDIEASNDLLNRIRSGFDQILKDQ